MAEVPKTNLKRSYDALNNWEAQSLRLKKAVTYAVELIVLH